MGLGVWFGTQQGDPLDTLEASLLTQQKPYVSLDVVNVSCPPSHLFLSIYKRLGIQTHAFPFILLHASRMRWG